MALPHDSEIVRQQGATAQGQHTQHINFRFHGHNKDVCRLRHVQEVQLQLAKEIERKHLGSRWRAARTHNVLTFQSKHDANRPAVSFLVSGQDYSIVEVSFTAFDGSLKTGVSIRAACPPCA